MKTRIALTVAVAAALAAPAVVAEPTEREVLQVHQRDFQKRGQAGMDRIVQDGPQKICTLSDNKPDAKIAKQLENDQLRAIPFPSGNLIGDWKRGERIASGGRGMTWNDNPKKPSAGGCYNCHQLSPAQPSYGTLGPSLMNYGKLRGSGADIQKYTYGKVYNAKAYNLCSNMPRFGSSGTLTEQQIRDVVAYLLDPKSPVNK